jgi:cell division protein FtsZ
VAAAEPTVLAAPEAPMAEEEPEAAPEPARIRPLPPPVMRPQPEPEERKRRFGLFGVRREKKPEPRTEPQMVSGDRAVAQPLARNAQPSRSGSTSQTNADDLFPDFKKEDQFEIPAFLRRQTN